MRERNNLLSATLPYVVYRAVATMLRLRTLGQQLDIRVGEVRDFTHLGLTSEGKYSDYQAGQQSYLYRTHDPLKDPYMEYGAPRSGRPLEKSKNYHFRSCDGQ